MKKSRTSAPYVQVNVLPGKKKRQTMLQYNVQRLA